MNASHPLHKHSASLALDPTAMDFMARAESEWPAAAARWGAHTLDKLLAACPSPATTLEPAAAGEYLTFLRQTLEQDLYVLARPYPSVQWLWYLRRLPDLFEDELSTTDPYDRALMELVATTGATKPCPALPLSQGQIAFPITDGVVRRVLRLARTTILLSDIHSRLRRAGKGISFQVPSGPHLPRSMPNPLLEQAIVLYDQRVANFGTGVLAPGTQILSEDHRDGDPLQAIAVASLPAWQGVPSWQGTPHGGHARRGLGPLRSPSPGAGATA
ncbi:hypothetical protein ACFUEN_35780 [Streptomyces griseorubiginosus]|uniref:hypothetical protein n=1 Tax=Streptomyces griseorubiginosus TaxID=67304 RepID=UPI00363A250A